MDVEFGKIYGIKETGVPDGYTDPTNGAVKFFVHRAQELPGTYAENVTVFDSALYEMNFTNHKLTYGNLTVSKQVDGNEGDTTKAFEFTVSLSDTNINGSMGDMEFVNGVASFTLTHGQSKTATGLVEGLTYTVTERDYSEDGYTTISTGETGTIVGNETANVVFTNTREIKYYSLCITKQDNGIPPSPLNGAGFMLYDDIDCTQISQVYMDANRTLLLSDVTDNSTLYTGDNGRITFYGLIEGEYYIKEFRTPTGYTLLSEPLKLIIDANGNANITFGNSNYSANVNSDNEILVSITDQKLNTDMPTTGSGSMRFGIISLLLMAVATVMMVFRKKRNFTSSND